MPKKRRRDGAGYGGRDACSAAMGLYEQALLILTDGEESSAIQYLEQAVALLGPAAGDIRDGLLAEVQLLRGRLVEVSDPARALEAYAAAHALGGGADAAVQVARRSWMSARSPEDFITSERLLRRAVDETKAESGVEEQHDAVALLARFLLERSGDAAKHAEARTHLQSLGYARTLTAGALDGSLAAAVAKAPSSLSPAPGTPCYWDSALPPPYYNFLRTALRPGARYYVENDYGGPSTGFFSFLHRLPDFDGDAGAAPSAIDGVLHAIWRAVASTFPAAKNATWVEWWAHSREKGFGHQLHYDSIPGLAAGDAPRHPIVSTVTYVDVGCGGPTLVFDQTVASMASTKGWLAVPETNRLLAFDGSLLHCVLPGNSLPAAAGTAAAAADASSGGGVGDGGARRTTFMANFWPSDPREGSADDPECTRGTSKAFPPPGTTWPEDFQSLGSDSGSGGGSSSSSSSSSASGSGSSGVDLKEVVGQPIALVTGPSHGVAPVRLEQVVDLLQVSGSGSECGAADRVGGPGVDMLCEGVFDCLELLGCEARSAPAVARFEEQHGDRGTMALTTALTAKKKRKKKQKQNGNSSRRPA